MRCHMTHKSKYELQSLMGTFLNHYLPDIENRSAQTIKTYKASLNAYVSYLENEKAISFLKLGFEQFEVKYAEEWIAYLKKKGKTATTINLRIAALKSFCKYCIKQDNKYAQYMASMCSVAKVRVPKTNEVKHLTKEQIKLLLSLPDPKTRIGFRDLCFMVIAYQTGARKDELLNIKLGDISEDKGSYTIKLHGKGNKTRRVPMLADGISYIKSYLAKFHSRSDNDTYLFYTNHKGVKTKMVPSTVDAILNKYQKLAKQVDAKFPDSLHCHIFRHSIATHMVQDGLPLVFIKDFLGHSDITTTQIYLRADPEAIKVGLERAHEKVEQAKMPKKKEITKEELMKLSGLK